MYPIKHSLTWEGPNKAFFNLGGAPNIALLNLGGAPNKALLNPGRSPEKKVFNADTQLQANILHIFLKICYEIQ